MSFDKSVICPVLIGRAPAVELIGHRLDSARSGNGQAVVVAGEAGIGKSRLVVEVKTRAAQSGMTILQGNCFEPDCVLPYAPLLDLLLSFCAARPPDELARALGPSAPELSRLLPELHNWLPDATSAPAPEPEQEKHRLFRALDQFLTRLAATQPVLAVFEDVHWSDETSLEYLFHLLRIVGTQSILLLLTYRSDQVPASLHHWLAEMDRQRLATEFVLSHLSQDEVSEMLRAIFDLPRPVRAEFLGPVYALTEGNPFFIEEVLKSLIATGEIFYADGRWDRKPIEELHIPRSVQDAVQQRLRNLNENARQVLTLAAVAGRRFDFALLQQLTHQDESELLEHIKELIGAQLVVEESAERFAFRHALTREAVYANLLARERKQRHRAIAETIERLHADSIDAHIGDLALHFYEAGVWNKAFQYSQRAGERAQAMYAPREAVEHFTRALEAAKHLTPTLSPSPVLTGEEGRDGDTLYRTRGQAYEILGEFDHARADLEAVLQMTRDMQDRRAEWQALLDLGFLWAARDYDKTGEYFRQALVLVRTLRDPETLGHTLNRVGNWYANADQPHEALRYHQEALDIFEELNDKRGLAETFDLLGLTTGMNGDWTRSQAYYERAIALLRELDDRRGLASALALFAEHGLMFYNEFMPATTIPLAQALAHAEESVKLAREIGWRSGEAYALIILGGLWESQGEYGRALSLVQEGLELAQEIEHRQWMTIGHLSLGGIYLSLRALDTAQEHLEQGLALAQETRSVNFVRQCAVVLALACILRNDLARAAEVLDSAFSPDMEMRTFAQKMYWYARAELALAQGDAAQALRILDELIASVPNATAQTVIPRLWKSRGEALIALGRLSEAETALQAAYKSVAARGMRPLEWQYHIALGKLYRLQRRREQAEAEFEAAQTIIEVLAASIPDEALRKNFRELALAQIPALAPPSSLRAAKKEFGGLTARDSSLQMCASRIVRRVLPYGVTVSKTGLASTLPTHAPTSTYRIPSLRSTSYPMKRLS